MCLDEVILSRQAVEPTILPFALFLSLSVAVMAGCAQAKVRHGMLSASESHPGVSQIHFCPGRSCLLLKEKGHKPILYMSP